MPFSERLAATFFSHLGLVYTTYQFTVQIWRFCDLKIWRCRTSNLWHFRLMLQHPNLLLISFIFLNNNLIDILFSSSPNLQISNYNPSGQSFAVPQSRFFLKKSEWRQIILCFREEEYNCLHKVRHEGADKTISFPTNQMFVCSVIQLFY